MSSCTREKNKKLGENAQMDQSLKESEPFLPCGWNVFVRAAVQMETLLKPLVGGRGWGWGGGRLAGWWGQKINTYSEFEFIFLVFYSCRFINKIHTEMTRKSQTEPDENIPRKTQADKNRPYFILPLSLEKKNKKCECVARLQMLLWFQGQEEEVDVSLSCVQGS